MRKGILTLSALVIQAVGLGTAPVYATTPGAQAVIQSGSAALQAGAYEAAIGNFTKALDYKQLTRKTAALTLLNRGLAYQKMGKLVEALADYDYALQLGVLTPKMRAVALYNRGLANRKLYRTTLALEDFTNALILDPRLPQAYNSRANVLRELGYYATAIEDYDSAIRFKHPQLHVPLYGKALAHAALRDTGSAKTALTRSLLIRPNYRPAKRLLARIEGIPTTNTPAAPAKRPALATAGVMAQVNTGSLKPSMTVIAKSNPVPLAATRKTDAAPKRPNRAEIARTGSADTQVSSLATANVVANPASASVERATANVTTEKDLRNAASTAGTAKSDPAPAQTAALAPPALNPKSYLIQLSAQKDPDVAHTLWNRLATKHRDLLGDLTPYIIKVETERKGVIYRIRAGGFASREKGKRLCKALKRRRVPCFVTLASK